MVPQFMWRDTDGNCRVKDKTILGGHAGAPMFFFLSWNYKVETRRARNTFSHYAQVFVCFWPSKSKVCVICVLYSL